MLMPGFLQIQGADNQLNKKEFGFRYKLDGHLEQPKGDGGPVGQTSCVRSTLPERSPAPSLVMVKTTLSPWSGPVHLDAAAVP